MEKGFTANQLKPGDSNFEYDKRIDFNKDEFADPLDNDSWEDSDKEINHNDNDEDDMDYFDDDFN